MAIKNYINASLILTGITVILQTLSFSIPAWLLLETPEVSYKMALWYVIACDVRKNITDGVCWQMSYTTILNERSKHINRYVEMSYSSQVKIQCEATSCLVMTVIAVLLIIYQLKSFHDRQPDQSGITDSIPRNSCNNSFDQMSPKMRKKLSRLLYSGGFAGLLLLIVGPILCVVVFDQGSLYLNIQPRQTIPFALFFVGFGGILAVSSGAMEMFIVYKIKETSKRRRSYKNGANLQLVAIDNQGVRSPAKMSSPVEHLTFEYDETDYYGNSVHDISAYHTQGPHKHHKHCAPHELFPGYKLGKHNLKGHDRKWWNKVALASGPYR